MFWTSLKISILIASVIVCLFSCNVAVAKFPNDPKPCKYGEIECITKLINYFVNERSQGDSAINLVKIDPLRISKLSIKQGAESPVNIDLMFKRNDVIGLSRLKAYKVKGFGKNLTERHEIQIRSDKVSMLGDYEINGRVLILPISGKGKSNLTMVNPHFKLSFTGTPVEKDGATYMTINDMILDGEPDRLYYDFGNLFNGDKALSDNMNLFLNENWREIYMEVKDTLYAAFGKIFEAVIKNVFTKYPYEEFFVK